jgi:hypothetical protein
MQLILCHDRLHRGHLRDLMALGLGISFAQWVLTVATLHRLDGDHRLNLLDRYQRLRLPVMSGLPARLTATGLTARSLPLYLGWVKGG